MSEMLHHGLGTGRGATCRHTVKWGLPFKGYKTSPSIKFQVLIPLGSTKLGQLPSAATTQTAPAPTAPIIDPLNVFAKACTHPFGIPELKGFQLLDPQIPQAPCSCRVRTWAFKPLMVFGTGVLKYWVLGPSGNRPLRPMTGPKSKQFLATLPHRCHRVGSQAGRATGSSKCLDLQVSHNHGPVSHNKRVWAA